MKLHISKELSLPIESVTQTFGLLAKRRAGKSYTMRRMAEQLLKIGQQVVLVDPKGDQWGIRSASDGKSPGYPIIILGGERADVPLEVNSGEIVAKLVVEERVSILIDLSLFRKHEVATFMTAFLENLYRLKAKEIYRTPMMLVIDEADAIAPQKPQKGEERMLGAAEDIVRRGGQRGIGCILVTQRAAVLNKNVLTQVQILIALRTIAPQDLDAMKAWIDVHGTIEQQKTLMESLPSLPIGDAWFWSPGWPEAEGIFQRVHVLPIETFDSGATPKPGEKRIEPKKPAEIDLNALRRQMASTIERAKENDPIELKKRVRELEHKLQIQIANVDSLVPQKVDESIIGRAVEKAKQEVQRESNARMRSLENIIIKQNEKMKKAAEMLASSTAVLPEPIKVPIYKIQKAPTGGEILHKNMERKFDYSKQNKMSDSGDSEVVKLPPGEAMILNSVAQYDDGLTRDEISVIAKYRRSSRDTYIARLATRGYVKTGARIVVTNEGLTALGNNFEPLPSGEKLIEHWLHKLPPGERTIFELLIKRYPNSLTRDEISDLTTYKRSSRDTYLARLKGRRLIEDDSGSICATKTLFQ